MTRGTLYGVSVGPGDPELITLKAVRLLQEADCVVVPNTGHGRQTALGIIRDHIEGKRLISCPTPMTRDHGEAVRAYGQIADQICAELDEGRSVAYAVLGDATIYSTYIYVHEMVEARGYPAQIVPGVSSLSAVAARAGKALCKGPEQLLVVPALLGDVPAALEVPGVKAFMKAGSSLPRLKQELAERGLLESSFAVANCGLEDEQVFPTLNELDEESAYFTVLVVRDAKAGGEASDEANDVLSEQGETPSPVILSEAPQARSRRISSEDARPQHESVGLPAQLEILRLRRQGASAQDDGRGGRCRFAQDDEKGGAGLDDGNGGAALEASQQFFANRACPHFPCHEGVEEGEFNCLFCYCPLYALGPNCGGQFTYTASGVKSCKACPLPHRGTDGTKLVKEKFQALRTLTDQ